jgi:hypothetical protein
MTDALKTSPRQRTADTRQSVAPFAEGRLVRPSDLVTRHLDDARQQLDDARERLKRARRRVAELEKVVSSWEQLVYEVRAGEGAATI